MPTGMIRPPARPWTTRNATRDGLFQARPHSIEASVKSTWLTRKTRLVPYRSDSQPVRGMTAASPSA